MVPSLAYHDTHAGAGAEASVAVAVAVVAVVVAVVSTAPASPPAPFVVAADGSEAVALIVVAVYSLNEVVRLLSCCNQKIQATHSVLTIQTNTHS